MPSFASEPKPKIIRKRNIHDHRMPEALDPRRIIVHDQIVLLVLVILLILEVEPHPEDPLCLIRITFIRNIDILIGDLFIILRNEIDPVGRRFDRITDCISLYEVHCRD